MFSVDTFLHAFGPLILAARFTLLISVLGIGLGLVIGALICAARLSPVAGAPALRRGLGQLPARGAAPRAAPPRLLPPAGDRHRRPGDGRRGPDRRRLRQRLHLRDLARRHRRPAARPVRGRLRHRHGPPRHLDPGDPAAGDQPVAAGAGQRAHPARQGVVAGLGRRHPRDHPLQPGAGRHHLPPARGLHRRRLHLPRDQSLPRRRSAATSSTGWPSDGPARSSPSTARSSSAASPSPSSAGSSAPSSAWRSGSSSRSRSATARSRSAGCSRSTSRSSAARPSSCSSSSSTTAAR